MYVAVTSNHKVFSSSSSIFTYRTGIHDSDIITEVIHISQRWQYHLYYSDSCAVVLSWNTA